MKNYARLGSETDSDETLREVGAIAYLKLGAFVTETGLEWAHHAPRLQTAVLSDASHLKIMRHNFSNVVPDS